MARLGCWGAPFFWRTTAQSSHRAFTFIMSSEFRVSPLFLSLSCSATLSHRETLKPLAI